MGLLVSVAMLMSSLNQLFDSKFFGCNFISSLGFFLFCFFLLLSFKLVIIHIKILGLCKKGVKHNPFS